MIALQNVSPREAYAKYIMGGVLVDVRENTQQERKQVGVSKIISAPLSELEGHLSELPQDRPVVLLSGVGYSSKEAARYLLRHGFDDVSSMDGGIMAWEEEGLPLQH